MMWLVLFSESGIEASTQLGPDRRDDLVGFFIDEGAVFFLENQS
jgi:hypothetical protein